ncbi:MAG: hypothetical protein M1823_006280 [Watsoniomyces obsoletus]|nr:MAG: hypothetical protein M1823_006280 [Watsoniomyces obsoletus]
MLRYRVLEFCAAVDAYFRRTRAGASARGVAVSVTKGPRKGRGGLTGAYSFVSAASKLWRLVRWLTSSAATVWEPVAGSPEDADLGDVPADAPDAAPAAPGGGGLGGGAAGGAPGP